MDVEYEWLGFCKVEVAKYTLETIKVKKVSVFLAGLENLLYFCRRFAVKPRKPAKPHVYASATRLTVCTNRYPLKTGRATCLRLEDCVGIYSSAIVATGHSGSGDPNALHMSLRSIRQLSKRRLRHESVYGILSLNLLLSLKACRYGVLIRKGTINSIPSEQGVQRTGG